METVSNIENHENGANKIQIAHGRMTKELSHISCFLKIVTEKFMFRSQSCYCSQDTVLPSCIIERTQSGAKQWTFCAEFAQCAVRKI